MKCALIVPSVVRPRVRSALSVPVLVTSLALACFAQAPPIMDTYTASRSPTTNYGTSSILAVQSGVNSYVQFNPAAMPSGTTVSGTGTAGPAGPTRFAGAARRCGLPRSTVTKWAYERRDGHYLDSLPEFLG